MPQVHNPRTVAEADTSAFGKNSRYMKANAFGQSTMRRVKALNAIEARFTRMRLGVMARNMEHADRVRQHQRTHILESYKRTLAYKAVVARRPIRRAVDYSKVLDADYSLHGLRNDIKQMLIDLEPDTIEKKKAAAAISASHSAYQGVIHHNQSRIADIVPKKKPAYLIEESEPRTPTPPPPPAAFGRRGPPLRGMAMQPQAVSLKMVKEKSWMGVGSPPAQDGNPDQQQTLNQRAVLPPIPARAEVEAAA